ncbi:hypothetical protein [Saccharibacillus kuerlensis]|uniref:DUF4179 domain-containing protein n=1 Tax=Saccharibacillus kuerlensis TaxID=459527 RepID=A0ABQ2L121_9BACL|nr:hypothetical protein [Saccharibacillus kuerlensis]GGN98868.1 hypothetical protein GCM10010969_18460 [Saccharibacillus kuerlensis]
MLRITESDTEKKLRELRKENPNYDAMWNRIRLETDKRGSGWQEQTAAPDNKESLKKKWLMPAACAALAAVIAVGAAASQGYLENLLPDAKAAPLGQSVGVQAEAEGVVLKLNQVLQGTERGYGTEQPEERMTLDFSLSGFGDEDVQIAEFDQSSITDLDTGKKLQLSMGDFNTNYIDSIEDWAANRTLNTSAKATGAFNEAEGMHRYRLEMSGLYMIRRTSIPIEGKVKLGQEYTVLPDQDFKMKISDIKWDEKQNRMTIKFLPNKNVPKLDTKDSSTLEMDRSNVVSLQLGDRDLGPSSWMAPIDSELVVSEMEGEYNIRGLTEDQISDMTMTFHYAEPVRVIEGPWTLDFTLDPSKAEIPTETVPVADDSELNEQTGWTLGEAHFGAYGGIITLDRGKTVVSLEDGEIVNYSSISLTDGKATFSGSQDNVPGLKTTKNNGNPQEIISFSTEGGMAVEAEETIASYDFRNKPLTLSFSNAWVAHNHPDHWKVIGIPTEDEQQVTDALPDGTQIKYKYHRKGKDVLVEREVPEGTDVYEGTRLRVDGKEYSFDPFPGDEGHVRDQEGNYHYVDVYRNVPEGETFEIGIGVYGTIDPTKNAKVIIRK